jgi:type II secretory pathway component GspD/PulD (secretin)
VSGATGPRVAAISRRLFAGIALIALVTSGLTSSPLDAAPSSAPQRASLRLAGVPVRDALARIAHAYGARIAVAPEVHGRVTATVDHATLDEALAVVLAPLGATWSRANRVVVVTLAARAPPTPSASPNPPAVLALQIIGAARAANVLRGLYPHDRIAVDASANALVVVAPPDELSAMRAVIAGIDVRDPAHPVSQAVQLRSADPSAVAAQLRRIYPAARITVAPNRSLLIEAKPADLTQITSLIVAIDTPPATPAPSSAPVDAVRVTRAAPRDVARAIANQFHDVRASVTGQSVVLGGAPDDVAKAKALIALIDQPAGGVRFTQIYRLRFVDARSVANLLSRSFGDAGITVDTDLNAISVLATPAEQQRITDALAQLDVTGAGGAGGLPVQQPGSAELGGGGAEVISLRAAAPGLNGAPSSSATDIATTVTQALQGQAPDLRITVPPNGTQLVLTGSPYALRLAKGLIDQLDVEQKLVVLDTEILEVDENAAKNLGLSFSTPVITTTVNETTPYAPNGGTPPPFLQFQPLTRSPISFGLNLNLLVQTGKGRVLADPRITTISGRTATIRAGDNIAILTTTGGGTGTVATTQLQTFQTGVTLDITPVVNAGNFITVALHPTVNSLSGVSNGIPQISTRDTQTTVAMREGQTLVIGGLIQDTTTTTSTKIPLLGDLPLIGKAFRNDTYNRERNELIIAVTPHVVSPDAAGSAPTAGLPPVPSPQPLPTLAPGTTLPPAASTTRPTAETRAAAAPPPAATQTPPAPAHSAAPSAVPSAFAATNVFTYGQPPSNNYAGPTDAVQIFFAKFSPTVLRNGAPVNFTAVTTTNVSRLTIGYQGFQTQIAQTSPGQWQSSYNFSAAGLTPGQTGVALTVTATRLDGASSSIQIPISVVP